MSDRPPLRIVPGRDPWPPSFLPETGRKIAEAAGTVTSAVRYSPTEVLEALARIVAAAVAAELEVNRHRPVPRPHQSRGEPLP